MAGRIIRKYYFDRWPIVCLTCGHWGRWESGLLPPNTKRKEGEEHGVDRFVDDDKVMMIMVEGIMTTMLQMRRIESEDYYESGDEWRRWGGERWDDLKKEEENKARTDQADGVKLVTDLALHDSSCWRHLASHLGLWLEQRWVNRISFFSFLTFTWLHRQIDAVW